jgi:hypothetical protein
MAEVRLVGLALLVVVGCGRVAFEVRDDGSRDDTPAMPGDDAMPDAPLTFVGIVAWLPLDQLTSTTPDVTGHGHTGVCSGTSCPVTIAGHIGNAVRFDGVDDELVLAAGSTNLNTTTGFTVSVWLRVAAYPGSRSCAAQKLFGTSYQDSWELCVEPGGNLFYFTSQTTNDDFLFSPGAFPLGGWHHVALTWDGISKTIWLDAASVASSGFQNIAFDFASLLLGRDYDGGSPTAAFPGDVDEFQLYDRALTPSEIAQLAAQ